MQSRRCKCSHAFRAVFSADSVLVSTRAGGDDLPQMAALLGGIVAQEVIKITTKQYVPLNGTLIFDGISSTSQSFHF